MYHNRWCPWLVAYHCTPAYHPWARGMPEPEQLDRTEPAPQACSAPAIRLTSPVGCRRHSAAHVSPRSPMFMALASAEDTPAPLCEGRPAVPANRLLQPIGRPAEIVHGQSRWVCAVHEHGRPFHTGGHRHSRRTSGGRTTARSHPSRRNPWARSSLQESLSGDSSGRFQPRAECQTGYPIAVFSQSIPRARAG